MLYKYVKTNIQIFGFGSLTIDITLYWYLSFPLEPINLKLCRPCSAPSGGPFRRPEFNTEMELTAVYTHDLPTHFVQVRPSPSKHQAVENVIDLPNCRGPLTRRNLRQARAGERGMAGGRDRKWKACKQKTKNCPNMSISIKFYSISIRFVGKKWTLCSHVFWHLYCHDLPEGSLTKVKDCLRKNINHKEKTVCFHTFSSPCTKTLVNHELNARGTHMFASRLPGLARHAHGFRRGQRVDNVSPVHQPLKAFLEWILRTLQSNNEVSFP